MLLVIGCFFLPLLGAGAAAEWVHRRLRARGTAPAVVTALLAVAASAGYVLLLLVTPFGGVLTEAPLFLATALALVPPMLVFMVRGTRREEMARDTPGAGTIIAVFLVLALVSAVSMTWLSRVEFARRLAWRCDGAVVKKYRSSNHQAPTLEVWSRDGTPVKLESCDPFLWERAKVGDHLKKRRWRAAGTLNGDVVRVVNRSIKWWNAPPDDVP